MSISGLFNLLLWLRQKFGAWFVLLTPLGALLVWFVGKLPSINAALVSINNTLVAAAEPGSKALTGPAEMWRIANYFAPVKLALALGVAILALKCVSVVVRIIKAFIPTISG